MIMDDADADADDDDDDDEEEEEDNAYWQIFADVLALKTLVNEKSIMTNT